MNITLNTFINWANNAANEDASVKLGGERGLEARTAADKQADGGRIWRNVFARGGQTSLREVRDTFLTALCNHLGCRDVDQLKNERAELFNRIQSVLKLDDFTSKVDRPLTARRIRAIGLALNGMSGVARVNGAPDVPMATKAAFKGGFLPRIDVVFDPQKMPKVERTTDRNGNTTADFEKMGKDWVEYEKALKGTAKENPLEKFLPKAQGINRIYGDNPALKSNNSVRIVAMNMHYTKAAYDMGLTSMALRRVRTPEGEVQRAIKDIANAIVDEALDSGLKLKGDLNIGSVKTKIDARFTLWMLEYGSKNLPTSTGVDDFMKFLLDKVLENFED